MSLYGLNRKGMDKLLRVLVDKNMLGPSESASLLSGLRPPTEARARDARLDSTAQPNAAHDRREAQQAPESACPQCGAAASSKALTCPECGHVLPGQQRWEDVDPKQALLDRVPPWLLGCILALPILIATIYVWKNIIVPMTEAKMEKKAATRKQVRSSLGMSPESRTRLPTNPNAKARLQQLLDRLIAQDILADVDQDGTVMTAGSAWLDLSKPGTVTLVKKLMDALVAAGHHGQFTVMDLWGNTLVTADIDSIVVHEALESERSVGPGIQEQTVPKTPRGKKTSGKGQEQIKSKKPKPKPKSPKTRTRGKNPQGR